MSNLTLEIDEKLCCVFESAEVAVRSDPLTPEPADNIVRGQKRPRSASSEDTESIPRMPERVAPPTPPHNFIEGTGSEDDQTPSPKRPATESAVFRIQEGPQSAVPSSEPVDATAPVVQPTQETESSVAPPADTSAPAAEAPTANSADAMQVDQTSPAMPLETQVHPSDVPNAPLVRVT